MWQKIGMQVLTVTLTLVIGAGLVWAWERMTSGGVIQALGGATAADVNKINSELAVAVKECRVCFNESEGSPGQCGGARSTCSGWSSLGSVGGWSEAFRDDTDRRSGGCRYQWRLECR